MVSNCWWLLRNKKGIVTVGESKVAIIGGGGFVGSKLGDRFVNKNIFFRKYDIEKRNDVDILSLDIEEIDTLDQLEDADAIINLAAVHRDDMPTKSL